MPVVNALLSFLLLLLVAAEPATAVGLGDISTELRGRSVVTSDGAPSVPATDGRGDVGEPPAVDATGDDDEALGVGTRGVGSAADVGQVAASLLGRLDRDHDGKVKIEGEAVRILGTVRATGVGAQVDYAPLLRAMDAAESRDGSVTAVEIMRFVACFDLDHDGRLAGSERARYSNFVKKLTQSYSIAPDGTRRKTERGFFRWKGTWYFRNEWGSVARATNPPRSPRVVPAPEGFDPGRIPTPTPIPDPKPRPTLPPTPKPPSPPTPTPEPNRPKGNRSNTVFDGPGIFLDLPANFSPDHARAARAAGFTWIATQGANAGGGPPVVRETFTKSWVDQMRGLGFKVGVWNVLGADPVKDAQVASDQIKANGLDLFIADVEDAHKGDAGGDQHRSKRFLDEFRRLQPGIALGMSTYAAANAPYVLGSVIKPDAGPMDYKSWHDAKAVFMPQVYPVDYGPIYSLANTLDHAKRAGWALSRVKPTLGLYRHETPEYYKDLKKSGVRGFSIYLGENVSDLAYWARLAALQ